MCLFFFFFFFFFQAEDGIRDLTVTGVQTCALPISSTLTLVGGAVGMLAGGVVAFAVASLTPIPAHVPLWSVLAAPGLRARRARGATSRRSEERAWGQYSRLEKSGLGESPSPLDLRSGGRSDLADVLRLQALGTLRDLELHRVALGQAAEAFGLDRREVDKHVRTRLLRDEAKALRVIEPLHFTLCHTVASSVLRGTAPGMIIAVTATRDGLKQKPRDKWSSRSADKPVTVPRIA